MAQAHETGPPPKRMTGRLDYSEAIVAVSRDRAILGRPLFVADFSANRPKNWPS
jgi:hypothetical protein